MQQVGNPRCGQYGRLWRGMLAAFVVIGAYVAQTAGVRPAVAAADFVVYGDAFAAGWDDSYSYSITSNPNNPSPARGAKSIAVTFTGGNGGLGLRGEGAIAASGYTGVSIWVNGNGATRSLALATQSEDGSGLSTVVPFSAPAGWSQFTFTWAQLGNPAQVKRITIADNSGAPGYTIYVDDVTLAGSGGPPSTSPASFPDATADRVLGQAGMTTRAAAAGSTGLNNPAGVAIGPDSRLFVVDYGNNRVVSWPNAADFTDGAAADLVLGQPDFATTSGGSALNKMNGPEAIAVDGNGNVFVADSGNHRILIFTSSLMSGMSANVAFGQYSANTPNPPLQNFFNYPRGLAFDPQGNLYLVDEFHNRVLVYYTPLATDTTPDLQFTNLYGPRGVAVDAASNVYITDSENDRVLVYDKPLTTDLLPDDQYGNAAPDAYNCFTDNSVPSRITLACPVDVAVDRAGNLFVADIYNHRIVAYRDPRTTDTTPDAVYGQPGYLSRLPNQGNASPSATTLDNPLGMAFDGAGNLYVADFDNHRLLVYNAPAKTVYLPFVMR